MHKKFSMPLHCVPLIVLHMLLYIVGLVVVLHVLLYIVGLVVVCMCCYTVWDWLIVLHVLLYIVGLVDYTACVFIHCGIG
jgi:hypothetical protein